MKHLFCIMFFLGTMSYAQSSGTTVPPPPYCTSSNAGALYTNTSTSPATVYTCSYYNLAWNWTVNPSYGGLVYYPTVPTTCSGALPAFLAGWPSTELYVCVHGVPSPIGGATSGVTAFLAPSLSWPSWLVPTVTNASTTPSLSVSAGLVPVSSGGTGASTAAQALSNLGGVNIDLQTNGTDNAVQSKLNLIAGTNTTITSDSAGGVTVNAAGNGATVSGTIGYIPVFTGENAIGDSTITNGLSATGETDIYSTPTFTTTATSASCDGTNCTVLITNSFVANQELIIGDGFADSCLSNSGQVYLTSATNTQIVFPESDTSCSGATTGGSGGKVSILPTVSVTPTDITLQIPGFGTKYNQTATSATYVIGPNGLSFEGTGGGNHVRFNQSYGQVQFNNDDSIENKPAVVVTDNGGTCGSNPLTHSTFNCGLQVDGGVQITGGISVSSSSSFTSPTYFVAPIYTVSGFFQYGGGSSSQAWTTDGGKASLFTNPMTTLGDTIYGGASGTPTALTGNTTATPMVLSETGDGTNAALPTYKPFIDPTRTDTQTVAGPLTVPTIVTPDFQSDFFSYLSNRGLTWNIYGDSIPQTGATLSTRFPALVAQDRGWTVNMIAVSGTGLYDQAVFAYTNGATATSNDWLMIGQNDGANPGTNPAWSAAFLGTMATLLTPNKQTGAMMLAGTSVGSVTGTWTALTFPSYGITTSTAASTATDTVFGDTVYVAAEALTTTNPTFTVAVDGTVVGTYTPTIPDLSGRSSTFFPYLVRVPNLAVAKHIVTVTYTGGGALNLDYIAGNRQQLTKTGPFLLVGNLYTANTAQAVTQANDVVIRNDVAQLVSDGLGVRLVDVQGACADNTNNATGSLCSQNDGVHPDAAGHAIIASAIERQLPPSIPASATSVAPAWLQYLGTGADGAYEATAASCTASSPCNLAGDHYYTSFKVDSGAYVYANPQTTGGGLSVHATGACTINGTVLVNWTKNSITSSYKGYLGGASGGSGGGTAAGNAGVSSYTQTNNGGDTAAVYGTAGAASGGNGGNGNGLEWAPSLQRAVLNGSAGLVDGLRLTGSTGVTGGSTGGTGGEGGTGAAFMCASLDGTGGVIDASGGPGNPPAANSTGAGSGGGGGVVILSSQATVTTWPSVYVAGGPGGLATVPEAVATGGSCTTQPKATLGVSSGALSGTCTVVQAGAGCGTGAGITWNILGGSGTAGTAAITPVWSSGAMASCTATPGTSSGYTAATYTTAGTGGDGGNGWYAEFQGW